MKKARLPARQEKRLRLSVFRSNKYIYAQIIDDKKGITLVSASDQKPATQRTQKKTRDTEISKIERARLVGRILAEQALKKGIKKVYFDRGRFKYHGRLKALAEGAREGGLIF